MNTLSLRTFVLLSSALWMPLSACRGWESTEPPVHLMWNMDTQEKGKAYRDSDFFADGRMMRQPIEGTVAQGYLRDDDVLHTGKTTGKNGAEASTLFPVHFAGSAQDLARGKERFQIFCSPCHGAGGEGNGSVASRLQIKPANLLSDRSRTLANGQLFDAISNGVNNGNMQGYAAQIAEEDRWRIVFYMRALQRMQNPDTLVEASPEEWKKYVDGVFGGGAADTPGPSAKKGEAKFKMACAQCHSADGSKSIGPSFKGLWGKTEKTDKGDVVVDEAYVKESIVNPAAKIVDGYPPAMPPQPLTDEEMQSMMLFLQTMKS